MNEFKTLIEALGMDKTHCALCSSGPVGKCDKDVTVSGGYCSGFEPKEDDDA